MHLRYLSMLTFTWTSGICIRTCAGGSLTLKACRRNRPYIVGSWYTSELLEDIITTPQQVQEPWLNMSTATSQKPAKMWNHDLAVYHKYTSLDMHRWNRKALQSVRFEPEESAYFGVRPVPETASTQEVETKTWGPGDGFILDFGIHMVGNLSLHITTHGAHMDAPCRLRLTFGEAPFLVTMNMDGSKTLIGAPRLPNEVIDVDTAPANIRIPQSHAFRYLRVEVITASPNYKIILSNFDCACVSIISPTQQFEAPRFKDRVLRSIDHASIATLRDSMHVIFQDGPHRDRRLWLGDLRIQALTSYVTFANFDFVKRCLFIFAAGPLSADSFPACVFDRPGLVLCTDYNSDYEHDALFAAIVDDYVAASGDTATGEVMWPVVLSCLERLLAHLIPDRGAFEAGRGKGFKFLDCQNALDCDAGYHGLVLYCLKAANALAVRLQNPPPFNAEIARMTDTAGSFLCPDNDGGAAFALGPQRQKSFASAAWLVLSGAFHRDTARAALIATLTDADGTPVRPLTPYLCHYVCEALATVGCVDECTALMKWYWGGMLRAGADTFWETFDPEDAHDSPYDRVRRSSFCHASSYTPAYLMRVMLRDSVIDERQPVPKTYMEGQDQLWIAGRRRP